MSEASNQEEYDNIQAGLAAEAEAHAQVEAGAEAEMAEIIFAGEESVKALLVKMQKLNTEKTLAIGSLDMRMKDLQEELRQTALPFNQQLDALEFEIKNLMPAIAHPIQTESGKVSYRRGYKKITYDSKALDLICTIREDIKGVIQQFRKESETAASVGIEIF